jgi:hypothetical protein
MKKLGMYRWISIDRKRVLKDAVTQLRVERGRIMQYLVVPIRRI